MSPTVHLTQGQKTEFAKRGGKGDLEIKGIRKSTKEKAERVSDWKRRKNREEMKR